MSGKIVILVDLGDESISSREDVIDIVTASGMAVVLSTCDDCEFKEDCELINNSWMIPGEVRCGTTFCSNASFLLKKEREPQSGLWCPACGCEAVDEEGGRFTCYFLHEFCKEEAITTDVAAEKALSEFLSMANRKRVGL